MFREFISTSNDWAVTTAHIALAAVMLPHGAQKLLGWFGGYGFANTVNHFASQGIPKPVGVLVVLGESLGALALLLGLGGRFMAFGIAAIMAGAVAMVHGRHGFFMNWFANQPGEGFEYHLLALGLAAVVMIKGSGAASLDLLLSRRLAAAEPRDFPVGAAVAHG